MELSGNPAFLLKAMRAERVSFIVVGLATICALILDLSIPWQLGSLVRSFRNGAPRAEHWNIVALLAATCIASAAIRAVATDVLSVARINSCAALVDSAMQAALLQSVSWHSVHPPEVVQHTISNGISRGLNTALDLAFASLGPPLLTCAGIITISLMLAPWGGLLLLGCTAVVMVAAVQIRNSLQNTSAKEAAECAAHLGASIGDAIRNHQSTIAFNQCKAERDRVAGVVRNLMGIISREATRQVTVDIYYVLGVAACATVLGLCGLLTESEQGRIYLLGSVYLFANALRDLPEQARRADNSARALERIAVIFARQSDVSPRRERFAGNSSKPAAALLVEKLEFEGVCFRYPGGRHDALQDVSFSIRRGERVAIVGHSGAGKSSVVRLLQGFYEPTAGSITIDGVDVGDLDLGQVRRSVAVVPQTLTLFSRTVRENVAYGAPDASLVDVWEAVRQAGAKEFVEQLPGGLDEILVDGGANLSGGQKQRILIARALLAKAPLLVLDEATSALDLEAEHWIRGELASLSTPPAILVIAHRLSAVRDVDRILVMEAGHVVAQGTHEQLMSTSPQYARLNKLWSGQVLAQNV